MFNNVSQLLELRALRNRFEKNHPKFFPFMKAAKTRALEEGSLIEPFGIGQIGKSFRNEITPGNFTFRTREFEQMELEFFCKPGTDLEWFTYWRQYCIDCFSLLY